MRAFLEIALILVAAVGPLIVLGWGVRRVHVQRKGVAQ